MRCHESLALTTLLQSSLGIQRLVTLQYTQRGTTGTHSSYSKCKSRKVRRFRQWCVGGGASSDGALKLHDIALQYALGTASPVRIFLK